jgi:hypothetical protein
MVRCDVRGTDMTIHDLDRVTSADGEFGTPVAGVLLSRSGCSVARVYGTLAPHHRSPASATKPAGQDLS